jgi:hypothetical protein
MSLAEFISIKTSYTRSINLERDADGKDAIESYIPTSRALRTITRAVDSLQDGKAQRAWSLVGPYGSGKSSFALFLSHLLGNKKAEQTKIANKVLAQADPTLAKSIKKSNGEYLSVLITGSPEPLTKKLLSSILESVLEFYSSKPGKKPKILLEISNVLQEPEITVTTFLALVDELSSSLKKSGLSGILFVIDELGKFLEYEARHYGANDIFVLQALAESAAGDSEIKLLIFVLLHQSFDQYAKGLGESLKNEWGKIQGRFEEVPFLESEEQVLRVVSAAILNDLKPAAKKPINLSLTEIAKNLSELDALPGVLNEKEASELFSRSYPLHPVTAMILPALCQKIAQNERTLFSYLGSHEEHGFASKLSQIEIGEFITPADVFDYFVTNQSSVMGDYAIHRRWVEVQTALERLGDASPEAINLLKTIGLFNILGSKGEFKPSKELLANVFTNKSKLSRTLKLLREKSVVNYRKFSHEFRVWQGSDFDLEESLQIELNNLGNFALADELNKSDQLVPVVARKYSIESGTLRYFDPIFVDARSFLKTPQKSKNPRVIFYLAFGEDDKGLTGRLTDHFSDLDIVVQCASSEKLRDAAAEVICLRKIQSTSPELNADPVAKREFEDRMFTSAAMEHQLIQSFLEEPHLHSWTHKGRILNISKKRELQSQLSNVLQSIYTKTPIIHNELINRDRPSTQANAARNKLLLAMQEAEQLPDLGMQKFPAEKAIYRALLKETEIHEYPEEALGYCKFVSPTENHSNIHHAWNRIDKFLASTEQVSKSFIELNDELMAPPYGVKAGLLPILYFANYLANRSELALYENRKYRPEFTAEMIERFTKRPVDFSVQRFRIDGLRASIFSQYSKVIHGDTKQRTLLELAKPLAQFMGSLPDYTKSTRRGLSERGQKVRNAFNLAKSPERLLFEELPKSLGFGNLESSNQADLEDFSQMLIEVLRELRDAHQKMLDKQKGLLAQSLNREPDISLAELRRLSKQLYGLEGYSADAKGLNAFISRLTKVEGEDEPWFENILMFLGHKPTAKWLDSDLDSAEYRLNDFANRILELEKIRLQVKEQSGAGDDVDFLLLKTVKKGTGAKDEVVAIDEALSKRIEPVKEKLKSCLQELENRNERLAALATLVNEFMNDQSKSQSPLTLVKGGKKSGE